MWRGWRTAIPTLVVAAAFGCGGQIAGSGEDAGTLPDAAEPPRPPVPPITCVDTAHSASDQPLHVIAGGNDTTDLHRLSVFMQPRQLALHEASQRLFYTHGNQLFAIDLATDRVRLVAGSELQGDTGLGGPLGELRLYSANGVHVAGDDSLLLVDSGNKRLLRIDLIANTASLVATGPPGMIGVTTTPDGTIFVTTSSSLWTVQGAALQAVHSGMSNAFGLSSDAAGNVYIAQQGGQNILQRSAAGQMTVVAGDGQFAYAGDGGPALEASMRGPAFIHVAPNGDLYVSESASHVIRRIDAAHLIHRVAGTPNQFGFQGDGGPATSAILGGSADIAVDSLGRMYLADHENYRIRRVDTQGTIETFAGLGNAGFYGDDVPATAALLAGPQGIAVHPDNGDIYFADTLNQMVRRVDAEGRIHSVVGTSGQSGFVGDGGPAREGLLKSPADVAIDHRGALYIADTSNGRVRKVEDGTISTVLGPGVGGELVSDMRPIALDTDSRDNLYIVDTSSRRVLKMTPGGVVSVFAGDGGELGFSGDGGDPRQAQFGSIFDVAVGPDDSVYIADAGNRRIRRVQEGIIRTVVGTGATDYNGEGLSGLETNHSGASTITVDAAGALYFDDLTLLRVRRLQDGVVQTVIGNGCEFDDLLCNPSPASDELSQTPIPNVGGMAVTETGLFILSGNDRLRAFGVDIDLPPCEE